MTEDLRRLSDDDLATRVGVLAMSERKRKAELVSAIAEFDARRLYLVAGCASLYAYCTQVLHLSEASAYLRIEAARLCRRFPAIIPRLADGRLSLTTATLLASVLTEENQGALLDSVAFKSRRQMELIVASMRPLQPVPAVVRRIEGDSVEPSQGEARAVALSTGRPSVRALSAESYLVQLTLSHDGHARLRRAQDLLRHVIPNGDVEAIFERALAMLVTELEKAKFGSPKRKRPARKGPARSRHVPKGIRNAVWTRDGGRCAYVGTQGRCTEKAFLEFHHVVPFAAGGDTTVENLQLRCAAHNAYEATVWFGADTPRDG